MKNPIINRPFPYTFSSVTFYLLGINIIFYMIRRIYPESVYYTALIPQFVLERYFIWQFVTYMFTHGGFSHILFNMLGLFFFGLQVEKRIGSYEFLLYYLLTGILAGALTFIMYLLTGYHVVLVGASGAIFAVLFAFAVYFPNAKIYIMGIFPIRAPILVIGYTVIELFSQVTGGADGVSHLTHLAGFGFAYLYFILRLGINPIDSFKHRGPGGVWRN